MKIGGKDLLAQIEQESPKLGIFLRNYLIPAVETTARHAAVSPVGKIAPPPPPESINVTTAGEYMQVTVNHQASIQKGIQYITHVSTDPQFGSPLIHDHGSSRSPMPFPLPTKDAGGNAVSYYVRTIAQYPGSDPSTPAYFGGSAPVAISMGGTTQMTLQPGTGSGTGAANGQQSAVGLGRTLLRPAPMPKRTVNAQ
jgi:hypothetical protein